MESHITEKLVTKEEAILAKHGLPLPPHRCALHPEETAKLWCTDPACGAVSRFVCALCQFEAAHRNHAFETVAERARKEKSAVKHSLYGALAASTAAGTTAAPSGVVTEAAESVGAAEATVESVPLVAVPRATALAIRQLLDMLPLHTAAAEADLAAARNALHAAVEAFYEERRGQLKAAAQSQASELQGALVVADSALTTAHDAATAILEVRGRIESYACCTPILTPFPFREPQASAVLSPASLALHGQGLTARLLAPAIAAVTALPPPSTPPHTPPSTPAAAPLDSSSSSSGSGGVLVAVELEGVGLLVERIRALGQAQTAPLWPQQQQQHEVSRGGCPFMWCFLCPPCTSTATTSVVLCRLLWSPLSLLHPLRLPVCTTTRQHQQALSWPLPRLVTSPHCLRHWTAVPLQRSGMM